MMNPFIIFSVFQADREYAENMLSHERVLVELRNRGISYTEVVGVYKGKRELSIKVRDLPINHHVACTFALDYNQECILLVDAHGRCEFSGKDGVQYAGQWERTEIPEDDYTYDVEADTYWQIAA
jgi:hypothetical protein